MGVAAHSSAWKIITILDFFSTDGVIKILSKPPPQIYVKIMSSSNKIFKHLNNETYELKHTLWNLCYISSRQLFRIFVIILRLSMCILSHSFIIAGRFGWLIRVSFKILFYFFTERWRTKLIQHIYNLMLILDWRKSQIPKQSWTRPVNSAADSPISLNFHLYRLKIREWK
jgi:hypothetical protein